MSAESSHSVAAMYADYPYPGHGIISTVVARMLDAPIAAARARVSGRPLRLLDAGCGTGEQTLGIARRYGDVDVIGIDISQASLDFASRLASRHGLRARFERCDLTRPIAGLGEFDVIVSVGALHHLAEPAVGLRHLHEVAASSATLLGMVYGTFGRAETFRVRDALSLLCGPGASREDRLAVLADARLANNTGLRHYVGVLGRRLRFGPDLSIVESARRVLQGRNAAYQADAFTHVQERTFTWAELSTLLGKAGWEFQGWPPRSGMPDSPEHVLKGVARDRLRGRPLLDKAGVYERLICPPNLYFVARATNVRPSPQRT